MSGSRVMLDFATPNLEGMTSHNTNPNSHKTTSLSPHADYQKTQCIGLARKGPKLDQDMVYFDNLPIDLNLLFYDYLGLYYERICPLNSVAFGYVVNEFWFYHKKKKENVCLH